MQSTDVLIIGGGAAGLFCAINAAKRGRRVLVVDHANKIGKKILMSGGGRCNFTNYNIEPSNYLSLNPHFCKSALAKYTQWDFIAWVDSHGIPYYEKTLGQLFCKNKSKDILAALVSDCKKNNVTIKENCSVNKVAALGANSFSVETSLGIISCESVVVATGGLSIPRMGATGFGYDIAKQFCIPVIKTRAALVPLLLNQKQLKRFESVAGNSQFVEVESGGQTFSESMLFTHKGLSGPAILQISSYWEPGEQISINLLPSQNLSTELKYARESGMKTYPKNIIAKLLTKALATVFLGKNVSDKPISECSNAEIESIASVISDWKIKPSGTEGYATAEVTLGGVDTDYLSSKTMEAKTTPGLYFIGEVVDVTGHLGGYNFQWAWSSAYAAAQTV